MRQHYWVLNDYDEYNMAWEHGNVYKDPKQTHDLLRKNFDFNQKDNLAIYLDLRMHTRAQCTDKFSRIGSLR